MYKIIIYTSFSKMFLLLFQRVVSEGENSSDDSDVPKPVIRRQNHVSIIILLHLYKYLIKFIIIIMYVYQNYSIAESY